MEKAEGIENLFFDFSSESRLGIIRELTQQNLKMKELARKLDLTPTEVFRQLQRLAEASVIQKLPDGTYKITNYGKLTLQLLPSLEFTFRHKAYFLNHDVSRIPYPFVNRIGELSKGTLCMNPIETINRAEHIFKEAENYAWLMAEKPLESGSLAMAERDPKRVRFRFLLSEFPQSFPAAPTIEKRTLSSIPCTILCTEKEAGVGLVSTEGRIDYTGFFSKDPTFVAWARDLFLHYWDLGETILSSVQGQMEVNIPVTKRNAIASSKLATPPVPMVKICPVSRAGGLPAMGNRLKGVSIAAKSLIRVL